MTTFKNLTDLADELVDVYKAALASMRSANKGGPVSITRSQISQRGVIVLNTAILLAFETQDRLEQEKLIAFHAEHMAALSDLLENLGPAFDNVPVAEKSLVTPDGFMIR